MMTSVKDNYSVKVAIDITRAICYRLMLIQERCLISLLRERDQKQELLIKSLREVRVR